MKYIKLLFLFFALPAFSQTLTPQAQVSLLTISPGNELYSTFGHSAIRISDPSIGIDVNYNYGTFNFQEPGFYLKFMRGYLNYMISSYNSYVEMEYWNRENRLITEQVLNLSGEQKQKIFDFLQNNLKPENRAYRYKFFTDNCSTRLRDVLAEAVGDSLVWDTTLNADRSYREWIHTYAHKNNQKWADFGMDLAIGLGSDEPTGWQNAMFIPDNLMAAVDAATVETAEGKAKLVLAKHDLNRIEVNDKSSLFSPVLLFIVTLVLTTAYTLRTINQSTSHLLFDKVLFGILGFAGWIIILLWFGTDHGVTTHNANLVWASPLLMPAIFYLKSKAWAKWLFQMYIVILVLGLLYFSLFTKASFSVEVFLVVGIILVRLVYLIKNKYVF